ncbi:MAG: type II pantothenate kinase [Oscillospiraceae bacterium]|nr:type II pantothenate kinase [Oscillospiraceae bacterium]MCL2279185.1 type II pantothenate kinase [Oscillospiraceae bacterium]
MSFILGIDVGGSTTKIVGIKDNECIGMIQVKASDQVTSMYGAIGNFLRRHKKSHADVSDIYLTGVGATFIDEQIYGIRTHKVSEFDSIGHGAVYQTKLKEALVVSMGTGTAFVRVTADDVSHLGGTGVGGGTIIGLSSHMLGKSDIDAILAIAETGTTKTIDLAVSDIICKDISTLPADLTASNFGKMKSTASDSDIALGIINLVFETIGMLAVFALNNDNIKDVVLTGTLATFPQAKSIFSKFNALTKINFIIPDNAIFTTALGAVALGKQTEP